MGLQVPTKVVLPSSYFQNDLNSKRGQEKMHGTNKSDIVEDDDIVNSLLSYIIYSTKPVNLLNTITEESTWTKKREIW